jgi:hypothetical protein
MTSFLSEQICSRGKCRELFDIRLTGASSAVMIFRPALLTT